MEIIKESKSKKYSIRKEEDLYYIFNREQVICTPSGKHLITMYLELAERILIDLEKYGYQYNDASSILSWQFTMIENFAEIDFDKLIEILIDSFLRRPDWTFNDHGDDYIEALSWNMMFGNYRKRAMTIAKWLCKCSRMQLTAICCIANCFESINIAYCLTSFVEKDEDYSSFAECVINEYPFLEYEECMEIFDTFKMYYGFHLKEEGPKWISDDENDK